MAAWLPTRQIATVSPVRKSSVVLTALSRSLWHLVRNPVIGCRPAASNVTSSCCDFTIPRWGFRPRPVARFLCRTSRPGVAHDRPLVAPDPGGRAARRHCAPCDRDYFASYSHSGRLCASESDRTGEYSCCFAFTNGIEGRDAIHGPGIRECGLPL